MRASFSYSIPFQLGMNVRCALVAMLYKKSLQIPEGSARGVTTNHVSKLMTDAVCFCTPRRLDS